MKKIGLFMVSLMATSLLINCGGSTPKKYTLTFNSTNCTMFDVDEPNVEVEERQFEKDSIAKFQIKTDEKDFFIPTEKVTFSSGKDSTYDYTTGIFSVKMTDNVTVTATAVPAISISTYTEDIEVAPIVSEKNKAYNGTIVVDSSVDKLLPSQIDYVYAYVLKEDGNYDYEKITSSCAYDVNEGNKSATLTVPADVASENIYFDLTLIDPTPAKIHTISTTTTGITISPNEAEEGSPYLGTISVNPGVDKILPNALKSVTLNDANRSILGDCKYTLIGDDKKSATLSIPTKDIIGDIDVELELQDPEADKCVISILNNNITIEPRVFNKGNEYTGTIKVNKSATILLPEQPTSIKVTTGSGQEEVTSYSYEITDSQKQTATLTIPTDQTIGNIAISFTPIDGCIVSFDACKGDEADPVDVKVPKGGTVARPEDPQHNPSKLFDFSFKGWYQVIDDRIQTEPFDFSQAINSDILLKGCWETIKKEYTVHASSPRDDSLGFFQIYSDSTTSNGSGFTTTVEAASNFKFRVQSFAQGSTLYFVPSELNITVNGNPVPLGTGYKINYKDGSLYTNATVTIFDEYVYGDIEITGKAVPGDCYRYSANNVYGIEPIKETLQSKNEDLVLSLKPINPYTYPNAENIYIRFDHHNEWVSPADTFPGVEEYCSYNKDNGNLTIKSNHIRTNIEIVARAGGFQLLEELSWEKIKYYAGSGLAKYLFYIGEEKKVKVNGLEHRVRIIGFDHDQIAETTDVYAGITFEFANIITKSNKDPIRVYWNKDDGTYSENFYFPDYTLNRYLQGSFYNMLPSELRQSISSVYKSVGYGEDYHPHKYKCKIFPLAYDEITVNHGASHVAKGEGETYEYYTIHTENKDRIKKTAGSSPESQVYHLRSPSTRNTLVSWYVLHNGEFDFSFNHSAYYPIAPAFCI